MIFGYLTLFVALTLSLVAAYYSVAGLTAIFAAAVVPIVIMGAALEVGKVTATVWLHKNWERSPFLYKAYLVPAVAFLMLLTSMGIFGFLSKAHSDQSLVSGDSMAKIAVYDEKIKISKDNIDANRKALKQMDEAVDQVMGRSQDEKGADKAVAIRRGQAKERTRLLQEIAAEQKVISQLNEERAPLAAENRKVEAEVGPIKYIAALLYGDNPDANVLERAVRWVIILIVVVFDPLALVLILAGTRHLEWTEEDKDAEVEGFFTRARHHAQQLDEEAAEAKVQEEQDVVSATENVDEVNLNPSAPPEQDFDISKHPYLFVVPDRRTPPGIEPVGPMVAKVEEEYTPVEVNKHTQAEEIKTSEGEPQPEQSYDYEFGEEYFEEWQDEDVYRISEDTIQAIEEEEAAYEADDGPLTDEQVAQLKESVAEVGLPQGKVVAKEELFPAEEVLHTYDDERLVSNHDKKILAIGIDDAERPGDYLPETVARTKVKAEVPPEAASPPPKVKVEVAETANVRVKEITADTGLTADNDPTVATDVKAHFGTSFPSSPERGEMYLRVDYLPSRLFKFNGNKWIEIEKELTDTYLYNEEYIKYLIEEIAAARFDADDLSDSERQQIADFLANEQNNNTARPS